MEGFIQLIFQWIKALWPFAIGVFGFIGGIAVIFLTGFSKEFFDERNRRAKHKLNVAIEVHKICNEASSGNFKIAPRKSEHVNSVLTDLDGVDNEIGKIMNSFVSKWRIIVDRYNQTNQDDTAAAIHLVDMLNEIELKRKLLVDWANKIRY